VIVDKSCVVVPLLQLYVYPGTPPETFKSMLPVGVPKHKAEVGYKVMDMAELGWVKVLLNTAEQPLASDIVTE
jgi:hypothetical protein